MSLNRPMLTAVLIVMTLLAHATISPRAQGSERVRTYDYNLNEVALYPFLKKIGESECIRVVIDPSLGVSGSPTRVLTKLFPFY